MTCLSSLSCFRKPKSKRHNSTTTSSPPALKVHTSINVHTFTTPLPKTPAQVQTSSPPVRSHPLSATLTPRALAAFAPGTDVSKGGDARPLLHTFRTACPTEGEVEYEYLYERRGKITWPLRRTRVDGKPVIPDSESESESEHEIEKWHDPTPEIEAHVLSNLCCGARIDSFESSPTTTVFPGVDAPRRMRIRVRRTQEDGMEKLKVRVRAEDEWANESVRRLPRKRRAALDERGLRELERFPMRK